MIKSITVTNYRGESLTMKLADPEETGFAFLGSDGLGPGKANINTTDIATGDGGLFSSARLEPREISVSLLFMDGKSTIEELRLKSYRYFPLKKNVTLRVETDTRTAEIEGYVESNEPTIFSSAEGASISIICPNPYFYSPEDSVYVFSGVLPMFEFPFSNESLTEDLLEMGQILHRYENLIRYDGDADTGITIVMHALGTASNIRIYNLDTQESIDIDTEKIKAYTGEGIKKGDDIIISTVQGSKSVTLIRDGKSTNILNCLGKNVKWLKLFKGDNYFAYTAETGAINLQFTITYKVLYEGV